MKFSARFRRWLLVLPLPVLPLAACGPSDVQRSESLADAKKSAQQSDGGNALSDITVVTDENCSRVCEVLLAFGNGSVKDCHAESDGQSAACHLSVPATGRAPSGLASDGRTQTKSELGAHVAAAAHLEAASIHAFVQLERELRAHGAPARLLRRVQRAAMDEVRHARDMAALARSHGAIPRVPTVRPSPRIRPLADIAAENAAEGCVRETWGALVATFSASAATDAELRALMKVIARDETFHAELAWAIDAWIAARLTPKERREVERARRAAVARLRRELAAEPRTSYARAAGLPAPKHARLLFDAMASELWRGRPRAA
jgi:hypothetical protein